MSTPRSVRRSESIQLLCEAPVSSSRAELRPRAERASSPPQPSDTEQFRASLEWALGEYADTLAKLAQ